MKNKWALVLVFVLTTSLVTSGAVLAFNNFGDSFNTFFDGLSIRSPMRGTDSGVNLEHSPITSAFNQPRNVGTSPHVGADMKTKIGTNYHKDLYPYNSGTISKIDYIQSIGWHMVIKHYYYNSLFAENFPYYSLDMHLGTDSNNMVTSGLGVGSPVSQTTIVGKTGNSGKPCSSCSNYPYHLHLELLDDSGVESSISKSRNRIDPNLYFQNRYGSSTKWVHDTTFIKKVSSSSRNISAEIYASASSDTDISGVKLWYKYSGESTWRSGTMTKSGDSFSFTIPSKSGVSSASYVIEAPRQGYLAFYPITYTDQVPPDQMGSTSFSTMSAQW